MKNSKNPNHARRLARRKALQAIYQWDMADHDVSEVIRQFESFQDMEKADTEYFHSLVRGVCLDVDRLDAHIATHMPRNIDEVDPIERSALRLACCEFLDHLEVPYRVVINEAIDLTKMFGAEQGHKFVNGVLDQLARELRSVESGG